MRKETPRAAHTEGSAEKAARRLPLKRPGKLPAGRHPRTLGKAGRAHEKGLLQSNRETSLDGKWRREGTREEALFPERRQGRRDAESDPRGQRSRDPGPPPGAARGWSSRGRGPPAGQGSPFAGAGREGPAEARVGRGSECARRGQRALVGSARPRGGSRPPAARAEVPCAARAPTHRPCRSLTRRSGRPHLTQTKGTPRPVCAPANPGAPRLPGLPAHASQATTPRARHFPVRRGPRLPCPAPFS